MEQRPDTIIILAAKSFSSAFSRLEPALSAAQREELAKSLYLNTLAELSRLSYPTVVTVVTGDRKAVEPATDCKFSALWLPQERGHSEDVAFALKDASEIEFKAALALPYDCPFISAADIDAFLTQVKEGKIEVGVIVDRHGSGTNGLYLSPLLGIEPSFGPGSAERHLKEAEAHNLAAERFEVDSLAFDIDTPEDLDVIASRAQAQVASGQASEALELIAESAPSAHTTAG